MDHDAPLRPDAGIQPVQIGFPPLQFRFQRLYLRPQAVVFPEQILFDPHFQKSFAQPLAQFSHALLLSGFLCQLIKLSTKPFGCQGLSLRESWQKSLIFD
jgi:hypothetical protein